MSREHECLGGGEWELVIGREEGSLIDREQGQSEMLCWGAGEGTSSEG